MLILRRTPMGRRRVHGWVSVLALGLGWLGAAYAQSRAGVTVSGTVVDESGAILPGASVQLAGPGVNRFQTTGSEGAYTFAVVPPGTYKLTVTLGGFGTSSQDLVVPGTGSVQVPA